LLELEFDVARVAAVLVVEASVELLVWFQDELCAVFVLLLLALLDASALWDALLLLDDFAHCAAFADVEFEVEFAFLAALEDELTFDAELFAAADWLALLLVLASVLAAFLAALFADALLDALAALAASPLLDEEFAVDAELF
jgi:hypothetical protein